MENKNRGVSIVKVLAIIVGVFIFLTVILVLFGTAREDAKEEATEQEVVIKTEEDKENIETIETSETDLVNETGVSTGEEGFLYSEGRNTVAVCKTKKDFEELVNTQVRDDKTAYETLLRSDKCYTASILDDFGKVLVIERSIGLRKIRFINTESIHYGKEAWTYMENVVKENPEN